ncbi:trihelix transcription factor GTL2-like isoform X3 [Chenopodium quinoa]|uniref:trihelix transcription factor GTL2-like isoform X2 n=1 Tax=Chenopodium quinoa TaxID=63459 RepID=UPI000B774873|nr:trihelix transcription factor GTL2-like isoform X2 [Chenopodium quinoa]XP_021773180.1 trihelix transcription factor GTL2-like isoform X3 [Chenopodium quinoa]
MFDGMPEQFYQFLAAAATTTSIPTSSSNILTNNTNTAAAAAAAAALSIPLSFSLHHHQHQHRHAAGFPTYSQQPPPPPPPAPQPTFNAPYGHLLHHHHHHHSQFLTRNDVVKDETLQLDPTRLQDGGETQRSSSSSSLMLLPEIPWSNDEMLALFRIRSSMDNTWFPDFIWENVSRKLAEIGFKRSAEKCKEKFEEETRSFNSSIISNNTCSNKNNNNNIPSNNNNNNNYRLFGELEELCNNNNTNNINVDHDDGGDDHQKGSLPDQCERDHTLETCLSQGDVCVDGEKEDEEDDDERPEIEDGIMLEGDDDDDDTRKDNDKSNDNDDVVEDEQQSVDDSEKTEESTKRVMKKRKRQKKFEIFKGFCEKIVSKMMAQQEELHCKIIRDMVKRDEEKISKEEAWKKQEFERLEKELEARAHEQAVSGDRQTKILGFLKKFSTSSSNFLDSQSFKEALEKLNKVPKMTSSNSSILTQDSISVQLQPTSSCTTHNPLVNNIPSSSSNENLALDNSKSTLPLKPSSLDHQNPNPLPSHQNESLKIPSLVSSRKFSRSDHPSTNAADHITNIKALENNKSGGLKSVVGNNGNKDDTGRRWPRDEVLALINIRCSLFNNNGGDTHHDTETYSKGPLWERISQKMTELGYKRSAKRCKEKWENINKYFRKTKDLNKKRSVDSRTCPYYHQLSHLYSQGSLVGPTDRPTNHPGSPENRSMAMSGQSQGNGSSTPPANNGATNTMQGNEANVVQVPGFDFEF